MWENLKDYLKNLPIFRSDGIGFTIKTIKQCTIFLGVLGIIFSLANPVLSMSQKKSECAFPLCTRKSLESSKDGYCIFHARAEDKNRREFKDALKKYIEKIKTKDWNHNFTGFVFVGTIDFERDFGVTIFRFADFAGANFEGGADFGGAKFQGGYIRFGGAEFQKYAYFRNARFQYDTDFWGTIFQGDTDFGWAEFVRNANFMEAEFEGESDFRSAEFQRDVNFMKAEFQDVAYFMSAKFQRYTDFKWTKFQGDTDFGRAIFQEDANFKWTKFQGYTNFRSAKFQRGATFDGAEFRAGASISPRFIKRGVSFRGASLENISLTPLNLDKNAWVDFKYVRLRNTEIRRKDIEGHIKQEMEAESHKGPPKTAGKSYLFPVAKEIYLLLKNNFHTLGRYDDESWAFKKEKDVERKSYYHAESFPKWKWLWSWFLNLLYGYGEKPLRVIISAGILIVIFAFLFMIFGIKTAEKVKFRLKSAPWRNFLNCLYFSTVTFTTLGYGDFRPLKGRSRLAAGIEAFIGAFMIALFVYTFARRTGGR